MVVLDQVRVPDASGTQMDDYLGFSYHAGRHFYEIVSRDGLKVL